MKPKGNFQKKERDKGLRVNQRIRIPKVRVIDPDGEQLGVMDTREALDLAQNKYGLDLIEVSPFAKPPVCKIMDFGKYKFQLKKKSQEAKKNQMIIVVKEIKLRPTTDKHDMDVKIKSIVKFLEQGNKVKVSLRFRGREVVHASVGKAQMDKIVDHLGSTAVIEQHPKLEGKQMTMVLASSSAAASSK
ncbi:MAG: translation initiation factor IF-3 [Deltaproteobacteria bacterium]|nr:translation initiation factor IF-3 [Deltaproteobacteria bacterium]